MKSNLLKTIIIPTAGLACATPTISLITSCSEYYIPMIFKQGGLCGTVPYTVKKDIVFKYSCDIQNQLYILKPNYLTIQTMDTLHSKILNIKKMVILHNDKEFYSKENLTAPVNVSLTSEMKTGDKLKFSIIYDEDATLCETTVTFSSI